MRPAIGSRIACYLLAIVCVMAGYLLFSPPPRSDDYDVCGRYLTLGAHAGFVLNCDSPDYYKTAADPSLLLADDAQRQSRPLYVVVAALLGHPLQWLADATLPSSLALDPYLRSNAGYHLAYLLLNTVLLLGSLLLFERIADSFALPVNRWLLHLLQLPLLGNTVSKAFFWTPHQQFFTVFTPLLTLYLCLQIQQQQRTLRDLVPLSLLTGVGMLAYGNFLPLFACLLLSAFLVDRQPHWARLRYNFLLFTLPTVVWIIFCLTTIGHYYNNEVSVYRQLVWIVDTLRVSFDTFAVAAAANAVSYAHTFGEAIFFIIPAALAASWLWWRRLADRDTLLIVASFMVFLVFFLLLGFYQSRLTFTLVPLCLCLLLQASQHVQWRPATLVVPALAVLSWHLYTVVSYGPFS